MGRDIDPNLIIRYFGDTEKCKEFTQFARACMHRTIQAASYNNLQQYLMRWRGFNGLQVVCEIRHSTKIASLYYPLGGEPLKEYYETLPAVVYWRDYRESHIYDLTSTPLYDKAVAWGYWGGGADYAANRIVQANHDYLEKVLYAPVEPYTSGALYWETPTRYGGLRPPHFDPETGLAVSTIGSDIIIGGVTHKLAPPGTDYYCLVAMYGQKLYAAYLNKNTVDLYTAPISESTNWEHIGQYEVNDPNGTYVNPLSFYNPSLVKIQWHPTEPKVAVQIKANLPDSLKTQAELDANSSGFFSAVTEFAIGKDQFDEWEVTPTYYSSVYVEPAVAYGTGAGATWESNHEYLGGTYTVTSTDTYTCTPDYGTWPRTIFQACGPAQEPIAARTNFTYESASHMQLNYTSSVSHSLAAYNVSGTSRGYYYTNFGYDMNGEFYIFGLDKTVIEDFTGLSLSFGLTASVYRDRYITTVYPSTDCGCKYPSADGEDYSWCTIGSQNIYTAPPDTVKLTHTEQHKLWKVIGPVSEFDSGVVVYEEKRYNTPSAYQDMDITHTDKVGDPYYGYDNLIYVRYDRGDAYKEVFLADPEPDPQGEDHYRFGKYYYAEPTGLTSFGWLVNLSINGEFVDTTYNYTTAYTENYTSDIAGSVYSSSYPDSGTRGDTTNTFVNYLGTLTDTRTWHTSTLSDGFSPVQQTVPTPTVYSSTSGSFTLEELRGQYVQNISGMEGFVSNFANHWTSTGYEARPCTSLTTDYRDGVVYGGVFNRSRDAEKTSFKRYAINGGVVTVFDNIAFNPWYDETEAFLAAVLI